jgi:hypothetical protein
MSQPTLPINQVPVATTFASGTLPSILGVIRQHPISVLPRVGCFKALPGQAPRHLAQFGGPFWTPAVTLLALPQVTANTIPPPKSWTSYNFTHNPMTNQYKPKFPFRNPGYGPPAPGMPHGGSSGNGDGSPGGGPTYPHSPGPIGPPFGESSPGGEDNGRNSGGIPPHTFPRPIPPDAVQR